MKRKQAQRVKTCIQLPPPVRRRLDHLATSQNRSLSNQIELILVDNLEGYEKAVGINAFIGNLQPPKK
jgi:predicted transcriptional regulator